jgi:hypothetical protein
MDATRISDGRPVMLKRLRQREGPYELQINNLFSTEPLYSNPKNHCVHLLDVIELPGDDSIMVHPHLRPFFHKPQFQTFGEFVTFFEQICVVSLWYFVVARIRITDLTRGYNSCTKIMSPIGLFIVATSYRLVHPDWAIQGIVLSKTLCLTHRICILNPFTPSGSVKVRTFAIGRRHIRGRDDRRDTFSSTLVFPVDMILPMDHHSTSHCVGVTDLRPNIRTAKHCAIHFLQIYTISET